MFGILDAVIIVLLLGGIVLGAKRGFIKEIVNFAGIILVVVLAYFLKNPLADLLFSIFPFIDFKDVINDATILNILFFETIAFIIVFAILLFLLRLLLKTSKIIQKVLDFTIIGGIISRILGAIVGFIEFYILGFIIIYILTLPILNLDLGSSKLADFMLNKTPALSNVMNDSLEAIEDLRNLTSKYKHNKKSDEYNIMAIDYMLKGGVITVKTADKLVSKGKLKYNGVNTVINKYR